mgnify:CR=1 FL=1
MINAKDSKDTFYILNKKQDTPIVLIHGVGLNHKIWEPQIDSFNNTVLAYDILGHGNTRLTKSQISFDDYRELREVGRKIANEFRGKPIYVISTSKYEYKDKKCPAYRQEQVLDLPFTGAPRNFDKSFAKTQKSFDADIYFVDVESYPEHQAFL